MPPVRFRNDQVAPEPMLRLLDATVSCSLSSVEEDVLPFTLLTAVPVEVPAQVNAGMAVKPGL